MSEFLVPLNSHRVKETLRLLSTFTGYDPIDAAQAAGLLRSRYPQIFTHMTETHFTNGALALEMTGSGISDPLLFLSHVDAPFGGTFPQMPEAAKITVPLSRAHLICLLEALETLIQEGYRPSGDLILCLSMDGLSGGKGALEMAQWLRRRKITPVLALDYGGYVTKESFRSFVAKDTAFALMGISEKGEWQAKITATEGETARPAEQVLKAGVSLLKRPAWPKLCKASEIMLAKLSQKSDPLRRLVTAHPKPFFPLICLCWHDRSVFHQFFLSERFITSFEAKGNASTVPERASLCFRQTLLPGENLKALRSHLERKMKRCGTKLSFLAELPATDCAQTSGVCWDAVCTAIDIQFDHTLILPCLCPFPTDSRFYSELNSYRFSPFLLSGKEALKGECRLGEEELQTAVQFFRSVLSV